MKKYFKFTRFREDLKPFTLVMLVAIVCQCYNGWSISRMMKNDIKLVVVWLLGSLIFDWVQIRNNSKNGNPKE